jgi:hypothetical protein
VKRVWHGAKRAHHRLISLPTALIIVMILATGYLSVYALRRNNLGMLEKRQAVVDADTLGEADRIEAALQDLQKYVSRHMNTSAKVELRSSYQRDSLQAQRKALKKLGNVQLYRRAEADCADSGAGGATLAQCINDRLTGAAGDIVKLPDARLYRYSFAAPYFSLDLAGLLMLIFGVFTYAGLHQLAVYIVRRARIKNPSARERTGS